MNNKNINEGLIPIIKILLDQVLLSLEKGNVLDAQQRLKIAESFVNNMFTYDTLNINK